MKCSRLLHDYKQLPRVGVAALLIFSLCNLFPTSSGNTIHQMYLNFTCKAGELFKLNCNVCICDIKTLSSVICTTKACRKHIRICRPFTNFKKECNECSCQYSGQEFCTFRNCSNIA